LRAGSTVQLAGVDIGQVDDIELDLERYTAIVELRIQNGVVITDDSIASVKTSGLIGDKYLNISPGAGDPLNPGDTMIETEPPLDIEDLIGRYIFGGVEDGGGDELDFE
ncbi:MAG: MlaD family protein, partial [bacterium]